MPPLHTPYYRIICNNDRGYYFFLQKKYSQKSALTFYPRHVERHQGCQIKALDLNIRLVRLNHILISFEMLRGILYTNNCGYYNKAVLITLRSLLQIIRYLKRSRKVKKSFLKKVIQRYSHTHKIYCTIFPFLVLL